MSRAENLVVKRLETINIECYAPKRTVIRQWSDRKKIILEPLIPGYVFLRVEDIHRDKILAVKGVVRYLRYNNKDAEIREKEIEVLKIIENKGYYIESVNTGLKAGVIAEIKEGPFKGMKGVVQEINNKDTYILVLCEIDLSFKIVVPIDRVSPLKK